LLVLVLPLPGPDPGPGSLSLVLGPGPWSRSWVLALCPWQCSGAPVAPSKSRNFAEKHLKINNRARCAELFLLEGVFSRAKDNNPPSRKMFWRHCRAPHKTTTDSQK
jgi:hypothetical protein